MQKSIRTDLALEAHELTRAKKTEDIKGIVANETKRDNITITQVEILDEMGAKTIGKQMGTYVTIEAPNIKYDNTEFENVCSIICDELKKMADISKNTLTLVVGLGNRQITPDALGCEVVNNLLITHHMKNVFDNDMGSVCAIAPGVLGTTGIETVEIIKGICEKVKPNLVIAVDALAAADIKRMSTTIQLADTGIAPGSGVGNDRKGINYDTLGTKVIAVGVPTVIDAANISDIEIPTEIAPLMVTSKDIDAVIKRMSKAVAYGINLALQQNMSLQDINVLVG